jgi:predicted secreted protein
MTTGVLNGNDLLVYVGGAAIACTDSCTFQSDNAEIDVTCKDNNGARQVLSGSTSWSITTSGKWKFDATYGAVDLLTAHKNKTLLTVKFGTDETGDTYVTGSARINSFTWEGPLNDGASFNVTFTGTGEYTIGTNA